MISPNAPRPPYGIALGYLLIGAAWIFLSDYLVDRLVPHEFQETVSIVKGWLFVLVTAAILALLLRRYHRARNTLERRLGEIVDNLPSTLYVFDRDGRAILLNRAMAGLFGQSVETALGKTREELGIDAEAAAAHRANDLRVIATGETLVTEESNPQADCTHTYLTIKFPLTTLDGPVQAVCGISTDITERKRAETALRASEEQFRAIFEVASIGIVQVDPSNGQILRYNETFREITGYGDEELRILNFPDLTHPDDRERDWELFTHAAQGRTPLYQNEKRYVRRDGSIVWVRLNATFVRDESGRPTRTVALCEDITEKKRTEDELATYRQRLEEMVRERTGELQETKLALMNIVEDLNLKSDELAAANRELEAYSYSVSHDLKAPLRGIDGYSRLLETTRADQLDDEGRLFIANIRRGAEQMNQLIEDLLAYSRLERRTLRKVGVDLPELVQAVVAEQAPEIERYGVRLRLEVATLTARADRDGLAVVLRNLLGNALKFSRDAQPPAIEIGARAEEGKTLLWVSDNGIGFDMKFHDRIFEIFQRLQRSEDFPGTGIGLALVGKAMKRMDGRVWAQSSPGQGATFFLELPP